MYEKELEHLTLIQYHLALQQLEFLSIREEIKLLPSVV